MDRQRTLREGGTTRNKILDVAEALFARSGYAGTSLQAVASAVGLGKSSLFHHFGTKHQLYGEVLLGVLDRIGVSLEPAFGSGAPPTQRLGLVADALVDALAEHPTTARLLLRALFEDGVFPNPSEPTPESAAVDLRLRGIIDRVQDLLREGIASGDFREVSIVDTTQTVIGAAVFHFASGEFGEALLGSSLFTAEAVARRRAEFRSFLHFALVRADPPARSD